MITEEIRSYEVSIWTLQDDFITVLKWSDVEHKGRILNPLMNISDDGMLEFSFSIPMYYDNGTGMLVENPNWHNTRNGTILVNLRKIKVIFNKLTPDEQVFEFIISKINETHELDILTCTITCDGLPFHELGKMGYQYSLSHEDYDVDYAAAQEKGEICPATVLYWCNKINLLPYPTDGSYINPRKWYYIIDMDWSSFEDGIDRARDIVYEEMYTSSWQLNELQEVYPKTVEAAHEKLRIVNAKESNIYNITLEIAKLFGIYCRYEYDYDDNYHIIGRKVIFFNNYLHDKNIIHLTYPYSSRKVSREIDSTDIITKMYVRSMQDTSTRLGEVNINYCKANKMQENYVLNFDYLKDTDAITKDLQDAIAAYENKMFEINSQLMPLYDLKAAYELEKTDLDAKITTYTNSVALDLELIKSNLALALELISKYSAETPSESDSLYIVTITAERLLIRTDKQGVYYIDLTNLKKGVLPDTIRLYETYDIGNHELKNEIDRSKFYFKYDEYGNATTIYGVTPQSTSSSVYATFLYIPLLYYDNIITSWMEKLYNDTTALNEAKAKLNNENKDEHDELIPPYGTLQLLDIVNKKITQLETEKHNYILRFNELMGPALREGYWQPDNYLDYSEQHEGRRTIMGVNTTDIAAINTEDDFEFGWDTELFDNEQKLYYESSVNLTKVYYPCINLSAIVEDSDGVKKHALTILLNALKKDLPVSVFFNNNCYNPPLTIPDYYEIKKHGSIREGLEFYIYDDDHVLHHYVYHTAIDNDPTRNLEEVTYSNNMRSFVIGSEAILVWAQTTSTHTIFPLLVLTGAKNMSLKELQFMYEGGDLSIGTIETLVLGKDIYIRVKPIMTIAQTNEFWNMDGVTPRKFDLTTNELLGFDYTGVEVVYPRVKFSSLMLKTDKGLYLTFLDTLLKNYSDYYINTRTIPLRDYAPEYLVTLKPEPMMKICNYNQGDNPIGTLDVSYLLSNASTAVYLDALKIAKENAYPKVSYTVEPNILNKKLMRTLYNKLNYLVIINDALLKFNNVFGYISQISLNLDLPQNDTIELKNYTSKFEDLFSTIVALTEQMLRNENLLGPISRGVYSLSPTGLMSTLESNSDAVVNFLKEKFLPSEAMTEYMSSIFLDASNILSDSNNHESYVLTGDNSTILSGFAQLVQNGLTATTYRQENMPTEFKLGDIWILIAYTKDENTNEMVETEVARYSATCNSNVSKPGYGWVKTYGGSYASLEGDGMSFDISSGNFSCTSDNSAAAVDGDGIIVAANNSTIELIKSSGFASAIGTQLTKDSLKILLINSNSLSKYLSFDANGLLVHDADFTVLRTNATDYIQCTDEGVKIHGTFIGSVTATSFTTSDGSSISWSSYIDNLAGWTISSTHFGNTNELLGPSGSTLGMMNGSNKDDPAFWAGGLYSATGDSAPGFKVTKSGEVYIKKLQVYHNNKWETIDLTKNFTDAVSYMSGTWNGETKKLSATIGLYSTLTKVLEIDGSDIWLDGYNQAANKVTANDEYNVLPGAHLTFNVPTTGGGIKTIHIYGPRE